jgi:hypothetical protein
MRRQRKIHPQSFEGGVRMCSSNGENMSKDSKHEGQSENIAEIVHETGCRGSRFIAIPSLYEMYRPALKSGLQKKQSHK